MLQRYVGDKAFYRHVMTVAVPIVVQNAITQFVSLLDNIMVGQVGTIQMSGVSIVNQLLFIFYLCVFGANAGAGIFTAQFHGHQDTEGIRHTFRYKIMGCILLSLAGCGILLLADTPLISLYLQGEGSVEDAAGVLLYGKEYLKVMLWGLLPFALGNAYATTLRETGQTVVPMAAGIVAVFVNLILNYVLIFGHLGLPAMGVQGAALATVISRYVELAVVASWTHLHSKVCAFIQGAYRSIYIPKKLLGEILRKGAPLMMNECLFATGLAVVNQCYSTCGLDVVPAMNITSTIFNLVSVAYMAMGNAVGIIMGQMLGAGKKEDEVRPANRKLIAISLVIGVIFGAVTVLLSGVFPQLYKTSEQVRELAGDLIVIMALMIPFNAYVHAAYFTLRSGGKTGITFLFDCGFMWGLLVPVAFILSRFTTMPILPLYFCSQATDIIKAFAGGLMVKKGTWIQNLTK